MEKQKEKLITNINDLSLKGIQKFGFNELPKQLKDKIFIIATNPLNLDNVSPYGTLFLRINKYPSDIDVYQNIIYETSGLKAVEDFKKNLQDIVRRVLKTPYFYFIECKTGLDNRFLKSVSISDKDQNRFFSEHKKLLEEYDNKGFISKEQYDELNNLINDKTKDNIERIKEYYRNLYVLRWSAEEILKGVKETYGGYKKRLEMCFIDSTMIKFDTTCYVNNKFYEFSNYFDIWYTDDKKHKRKLNPNEKLNLVS